MDSQLNSWLAAYAVQERMADATAARARRSPQDPQPATRVRLRARFGLTRRARVAGSA